MRTQMISKVHIVVASGSLGQLSSDSVYIAPSWTTQTIN